MANTMTVTSPQLAGQPTQQGSNTLLSTSNFPTLLSGGTLNTNPQAITSQLLGIVIDPVTTGGALSGASLDLRAQVNGSTYRTVKTYTNAQIAAGLHDTVQIKALGIQFFFTPGATPSGSGCIIRVLD